MNPYSREVIKLHEGNPEFIKQIQELGAPDITVCYQCGGCTGDCPASKWSPFKIRRIMDRAMLGMEREVLEDPLLWDCVTCWRCKERCPQKAGPADVIFAIRRLKTLRKETPKVSLQNVRNIMSMGTSVPLEMVHRQQREKLGLDGIPQYKVNKAKVVTDLRHILSAICEQRGVEQYDLIGYSAQEGVFTGEEVV